MWKNRDYFFRDIAMFVFLFLITSMNLMSKGFGAPWYCLQNHNQSKGGWAREGCSPPPSNLQI